MTIKTRRMCFETWLRTHTSRLIFHTGLYLLLRCLQRPRILVLAYHRVTPPEQEPHWDYPHRTVTTTTFERQLRSLRHLYRFVSMQELQDILESKKPLRRHVALVTFDDGYRDNYEHALPILKQHGVPAAFFLSLGFVGERRNFWFDRLADACRVWESGDPKRARLRSLLPAPLAAIFEARSPRAERLQRAVQFVARLPVQERRALLKRLTPEPQNAEHEQSQALTWTEVRQLREQGMSIGAHGLTHTTLTRMSTENAKRELGESIAGVARGSGAPVVAFAYPHGATDADVAQWASEAGVRLGFTLEPRENQLGDDPMRLGRHNICEQTSRAANGGFSAALFACTLAGWVGKRRKQRAASVHATGALVFDLNWTGPQEVSAGSAHLRIDPTPAAETSPAARVEGQSVTKPARVPRPLPVKSVTTPRARRL
ncbi:MAG TPA: polysaccharide deacetylase family protein [Candidatus Krumholzibacteria bacterium]|nr:polysaccharide deacetylase family protein [Candidatus Krumholzibacteria bacterium]